jgi:fermentation-respiration switch protein FrsA (DUF1100 family)
MERVDFPALLKRVDEGYLTWRKPSLLLFGSSDQFVPFKSVFEWLDSKRTSMKLASNVEAKLGHNPQVGGTWRCRCWWRHRAENHLPCFCCVLLRNCSGAAYPHSEPLIPGG